MSGYLVGAGIGLAAFLVGYVLGILPLPLLVGIAAACISGVLIGVIWLIWHVRTRQ